MPELVPAAEPLKLLLALSPGDDAKQLADILRSNYPELRIDTADGVVEALVHLCDSPPDVLVVGATLPGIDIRVLCSELGTCSVSARVRVVVVRPMSMAAQLDESLRAVGVWTVLDEPASPDAVAECLSLGNFDLARPKAS
jgi:hypothetical protein